MSCILCSSNAYQELGTIKEYKIVKCAQCTFVYAHPLPKMDELIKYYGEHIPEKFKPHKGLVRKYKYYFLIRSIRKHFPKDKQIRLLEIGCSYGRLLSSLQLDKQFKATGIDLTDVSVEYARSLGLNVLKGTLESQAFPNESYDVVVAHHLLRIPGFTIRNKGLRGTKTCDFALYRKDFLAVNGLNEDFVGWGREDSELAVRLFKYGLKRKDALLSDNVSPLARGKHKRIHGEK